MAFSAVRQWAGLVSMAITLGCAHPSPASATSHATAPAPARSQPSAHVVAPAARPAGSLASTQSSALARPHLRVGTSGDYSPFSGFTRYPEGSTSLARSTVPASA